MYLDVNECQMLNGGCEHHCINTNGSYVCKCNKGFFLDGNEISSFLNFPNSVVKARISFFARYDVRNVRLKYVYLQPCSQGFIWIISKLLFYKTNFVLRF